MASEKEINEQAQEFLNAMAPNPVPSPSRKKKEVDPTETVEVPKSPKATELINRQSVSELTQEELDFMKKYLADNSDEFSLSSNKHVLIDSAIHSRLSRFVKMTGNGKLVNLLNNILSEFISQHEEIFQSILTKYLNKKF